MGWIVCHHVSESGTEIEPRKNYTAEEGIKYVRVKLNLEKTVEFFFNLQKLQKVLK